MTTPPHKLAFNELNVVPQSQGLTNACGSTSLAEVMTYWGQPTTHEQVDEAIRHYDLFTAPDAIVAYAVAHGMQATLKADADLDDVARVIDQGVPVIIIIDPDESNNLNLHYLTICGYNLAKSGLISDVVIANSAWAGERYCMPVDYLMPRWNNLRLNNIPTGLSCIMISIAPKERVVRLPGSDVAGTLKSMVARGVASAVTGITSVASDIAYLFRKK